MRIMGPVGLTSPYAFRSHDQPVSQMVMSRSLLANSARLSYGPSLGMPDNDRLSR